THTAKIFDLVWMWYGSDSGNSANGLNRDPVVNMCLNFLHGSDSEQWTHEFMHIYLVSAKKTEHNTDFHQIVDFLEASDIRYALMVRPTVYVSHIRQFWSTTRVETMDGETKIIAKGKGSEHPSKPHHTPSDQDEPIHLEQITQSPQHAQITSHEPITQFSQHEQTTSQEPTIPSQSHSVITTPRRITRGAIWISQSKVPSPEADETAFPTGDVRYREAFPTVTSLEAGHQDMENIAKTSVMPHEASPRVTSLGSGKGGMQQKLQELMDICTSLQSQYLLMEEREDAPNTGGMDQGEDLLVGDTVKDSDKSNDKVSDSTNDMDNVLGTLGAANILASRGLKLVFTTTSLSVATASTVVSSAIATASRSFPTAVIFITASVATPTTRVTRSSRGFVIESSSLISVNIPSISKKDKGKRKMTEPEQHSKEKVREQMSAQLARDLEAKELKMMIAELDRSNEIVAKYLKSFKNLKTTEASGTEPSQEQQSKEPKELKKMIELVPVEELYIEALQVKYLIIDWEIYSEDQRKYWKIIRVGNHVEVYQIFDDMLKKFDREGLDKIWSLVKETCSTIKFLESYREEQCPVEEVEKIQVSVPKKKPNQRRQSAQASKTTTNQKGSEEQCFVPWTLDEETASCKSWVRISEDNIEEFRKQRDEQQSKRHKSSDDSSFNTRGSGEGSFNLNSMNGDEEDEVEEVRPSRPIIRDQAKRKGKAGTLSASSTTGVDVESLAKLMVNEYPTVSERYSVQKGQNMTELLQMEKMDLELKAEELAIQKWSDIY
nr:hypothetical protein [Tanacetum cinerariifolium]